MTVMVPSDEVIREVFQLAYFIIGEKDLAIRITSEALARLGVTVTTQKKRSYYSLAGRREGSGKASNKVSLSKTQLLQRLVSSVSEPYEQNQERTLLPSVLSEDDMMIRYIKHLVKLTLHRNSFYVTVGFGRVLYNYPTNETMTIFGFLSQNPDGGPDDHFYRHKKKDLLSEIKERFGKLLTTIKVEHGEERFEPHPDQRRFLKLVNECLERFTPWESGCVLPEKYDPRDDEIPQLLPQGNSPEAKQRVEVNRIHLVIHPVCFERVVTGLGFDAPAQRLDLPSFFLAANMGSEPPGGHRPPVDLSAGEIEAIQAGLDQEGARRRKASTGQLRICVDHHERMRISPGQPRRARIPIGEADELVEVWGEDKSGTLLLAALLLNGEDLAGDERRAEIVLAGDERISFAIHPLTAASSEESRALLEVTYREGGWLGWLRIWREHLADLAGIFGRHNVQPIVAETGGLRWARFKFPIAALSMLFVGLTSYFLFNRSVSEKESQPNDLALNRATPAQSPGLESINPPAPTSSIESSTIKTPQAMRQVSPAPVLRSIELTKSREAAATLATVVKMIFLEVEGTEQDKELMQSAIIGTLDDGNPFRVVRDKFDSDAVLKIEIKRNPADNSLVSVVKLLKGNQVLWPPAGGMSGRPYPGPIETAAAKLVGDLKVEFGKSTPNQR